MHVIATAGHVDHGKSTLVRALTGMEPDRWAEERRRGMTIDLGFAWTRLPSGEQVAFVDVPGHARFVSNMLAGVGPVPAVLLVVAADEGWQPQSAEHLAALDALGVRHGLLVVTRSDLADPAAALAEACAELARTSLAGAAAVTVSGATGAGLDQLRSMVDRLVAGLPPPDLGGPVRVWVDRAFTVKGAGTVVTGTLGAGRIDVGDELLLTPTLTRVRVRGLHALGTPQAHVAAVARVAVKLRGVDAAEVRRGAAVLTPGAWLTTREVDVRLSGDAATDLPAELVLHVGSAAVPARVRPLGAEGARLALAAPLPLRIADRALLRDPGRHRVAAGVLVLDVRPPALRRRGAAAARAAELAGMDGRVDLAGELRRRGLARRPDLIAMGVPVPEGAVGHRVGEWLVDPARWRAWQAELLAVVERHTAEHPLDPGLPVEAARRALALPDVRLVPPLVTERLTLRGGRLFPTGAGAPTFPPSVLAALDEVRARLAHAPYAAPEAHDLDALGLTPAVLGAATKAGLLLRVAEGIYLLPGADAAAAAVLAGLPQPFPLTAARQALGTTRRVAVPLLEHLDARGLTRRVDASHREVVRCAEAAR